MRSKVFAALFQHHGKFELVVQLLRQVFGINNGFFVADDRVYVLEEHDPWHDWMRKTRARSFLVVFAKISCGMEKFPGNDWRLEFYFVFSIKDHFTPRIAGTAFQAQGILECFICGLQACVPALKERSHVGWN